MVPLRILIIEDSEEDLLLLVHELVSGGYQPVYERVETAGAMLTALRDPWDVIISDYIMPQFSGLEALDVLKKTGLDIPFIIVSGRIGEDTAVKAMKAGAHDYIIKGNLSRLVPAVKRELREAETRQRQRTAEEELRKYQDHLEELVEARTAELTRINDKLHQEIGRRETAENELRDHRDHLEELVKDATAELRKVNKDLRAEIMRRIQMEKDLIESRRFVQRITDTTPNLLYLYDVIEGETIYINPRVKDILGYTPEEVKKMRKSFYPTVLHPGDLSMFESARRNFSIAGDGDIMEIEYRMKNSAGEWRWFHCRDVVFKRSADDRVKLILGIAQDITERRQGEEDLKSSREQLRALLAHLQSVREEERTRISREIHDELGQALTAVKMDLAWLVKRLDKGKTEIYEKTESMSKLVDASIQTVKRISTELRPGLLDNIGLPAALEWQADEFQKRTGITCSIKITPDDIILDRNRSTAIFRIFQEALTNVARHAAAKKVTASLKKKEGAVILQVRDDGKGITEEQISSPDSIGLIGMRERIHFLGGKIKITGKEGKGTSLSVSIPFYRE